VPLLLLLCLLMGRMVAATVAAAAVTVVRSQLLLLARLLRLSLMRLLPRPRLRSPLHALVGAGLDLHAALLWRPLLLRLLLLWLLIRSLPLCLLRR
jgi:hypothetical protein